MCQHRAAPGTEESVLAAGTCRLSDDGSISQGTPLRSSFRPVQRSRFSAAPVQGVPGEEDEELEEGDEDEAEGQAGQVPHAASDGHRHLQTSLAGGKQP